MNALEHHNYHQIEWVDRLSATVEHLQMEDARGELDLENRCHLYNALRALESFFEHAPEAL